MTIKTLEYIHALLIEDERKRKEDGFNANTKKTVQMRN